ncbi:MAG: hypothetical protein ACLQVL_15990 [Terriglobia bacterium]
MRLAIIVFLLLCWCQVGTGLGRESGGLEVSIQDQSGQAQKGETKPITNDDVVNMVKAGLAESTIVLAIHHSSAAFDTSPQALISLQSQGVPQRVLDAMLTAGSERPTHPTTQTERTNPAGVGGNGKWDVRDEISPDTGSRTVTLTLPAEQGVAASAGLDKYPRLNIRCRSRQTVVYIRTGSLPADADANAEYRVQLRVDDGQPSIQPWEQSTGHDSLFAPDPVEFARLLAGAKKLAVEFTPPGSGPVATSFDLTGLDAAVAKVADACGWSLQGEPAASAKDKGNPRDLHAIRKVLLDADWSDDDDVLARKSEAIAKRTCLQVVDTSAAADAILKWSIQGFTGGALELRTKDGQVIWSKAGSVSTPLTALKQAVGCPK